MSMYFRLYVRDAKQMLVNLKLNPSVRLNQFKNIKLYVILKNPEIDVLELPEIFSLAAEINMEVITGFRLMETKPASGLGWLDVERWTRNASYLNLIVNSVAALTTTLTTKFKIALDIEDYAGSMPIPTTDQMLVATSQFTTAIKALRITPCVYPAETAPEVLDPIISCVNNDAELWTEIGFPLSKYLRSNSVIATSIKARMFQFEHDLKARWPGVKVVHGSGDDIIRDFTLPAIRDALIKDLGFGWIFDSIRIDNPRIGTPEWCTGLTASTTNDVKHCFFAEPNSISFLKGWPSGASYSIVQAAAAPPIRTDLRSTAGTLLTNGVALRYEIMQRDAREGAVACNFQLPVNGLSGGPIFGASQANSESWQMTYDQQTDSIVFDVYQVAVVGQLGTRLRTTIMEHPLKGTPIKFVASLKDGAWSIIGTGMPAPVIIPVIRPTVGAGHIWIGAGTNCDGSRKTVVFDNIVVISVESWHRALFPTEHALALASWPRVK